MALAVGQVAAELMLHSQVAEEQPWVQAQLPRQQAETVIAIPTPTNGKQMASQEEAGAASLLWAARNETALEHGIREGLAAPLASDVEPPAALGAP